MENRILVWDIPTRLFHWLFAGSFAAAFVVANVVDDEAPAFALHALFGGVMAILVLLRIGWGFVGTRHARFTSFPFSPKALFEYLKGALLGTAERHTGHNPGSGMATYLMLALALAIAGTGALISTGGKVVKELHEALAFTMVGVVVFHVLGLALHTLRHRENISRSMIDGRKVGDPALAIPSARPLAGVAFVVLVAIGTWGLVRGYDSKTSRWTIPFVNRTIRIVDAREGEERGRHRHDERD